MLQARHHRLVIRNPESLLEAGFRPQTSWKRSCLQLVQPPPEAPSQLVPQCFPRV